MGSTPAATGTLIHEAGHYLGLYHTFQGSCTNNNCLNDGDKVCDTPPDASTAYIACNGSMNSCSTDTISGFVSDQPDMHKNYMDYTQPTCRTIYTAGQRDRMLWHIANVRSSLLNCNSCNNPCPSPVLAKFTPSATTISVGGSVNFTNASTGASSYQWLVNGVQFANSTNSSFSFNNAGTFSVKLVATGSNFDCFDDTTITIKVTCGAVAQFTPPAANVAPNITYNLTNTSTGTTTYRWFSNGVQVSTATNFAYQFPANGVYWVYLVACNNFCCDTSDSVRVFVCSPCIEICDNGIDDDGDNLVDCIDPDCVCNECSGKQADNWYFGQNAALNFKTSPPTVVSGSQLNVAEGSAVISDANGTLMFYTDGQKVWNRNNQVMPNGTGLIAHSSSTSCVAIQHPTVKKTFYIFHTGTNDLQNTWGVRYSTVDMSLNFGLGDVVSKNTTLVAPNDYTEKIAVVKHCNNRWIWIITHKRGSNEFLSYLIDSTGLNTTPIISAVGKNHDYGGGLNEVIGYMRTSVDGKKLVNALYNWGGFELFDFNNSTGALSNPVLVNSNVGVYSAEFSKDNQLLYVANHRISDSSQVIQYDISIWDSNSIKQSKVVLASRYTQYDFSAVQRAIDDRIYISFGHQWPPNSLQSSISLIEKPEVKGAGCQFKEAAINLGAGKSYMGFPVFLQSYFVKKFKVAGSDTVCSAPAQTLKVVPRQPCDAITNWSIIGNAQITSQSDTSLTLTANQVGNIKVIANVSNTCNASIDTFNIFAAPCIKPNLGPDTSLCVAGVVTLKAGIGYKSYLWSDGLRDSINTFYGPGTYYVQVVDVAGNIFSDTVVVGVDSTRQLSIGNDTTICKEQKVDIEVGDKYESYGWAPPIGLSCGNCHNPTARPSLTTTYTVTAKSSDGCIGAASITIFVDQCLGIENSGSIIINGVYPSPASDILNIVLNSNEAKISLKLFNAIGQKVKDFESIAASGQQVITMDVSSLANGVYVLEAQNNKGTSRIKVTIQ